MNTKEVAELRRRWRPEKNAVKRIYGCLVNASGGILADLEEPLSMLPLEETEQYFALLKKTLSGRLGKNLIDLVFSTQQVADSEEHRLLMALRSSGLQDLQARRAFYEKAAQTLDLQGNYLLLLAHDTYDVPSKGKDDLELDSDTVFSYLLCAVCPVKEGKPGLGYFAGDNEFHCCVSQTVAPPEYGFLFPAFDDRAANLYNALFYCRRPDSQPQAFLDSVFHTEIPMPAQEQKENFQQSLAEALGEEYSLEVAQEVYSQITGRMEEHKASHDPEPLTITAKEMARVLEECDVPPGQGELLRLPVRPALWGGRRPAHGQPGQRQKGGDQNAPGVRHRGAGLRPHGAHQGHRRPEVPAHPRRGRGGVQRPAGEDPLPKGRWDV